MYTLPFKRLKSYTAKPDGTAEYQMKNGKIKPHSRQKMEFVGKDGRFYSLWYPKCTLIGGKLMEEGDYQDY